MKCFVVIRDADGFVVRTGTCGDDDVELQAHAGETGLEAAEHYCPNDSNSSPQSYRVDEAQMYVKQGSQ